MFNKFNTKCIINNKKLFSKSIALTIGNFDGIHLGHQLLIEKLKERAKKLNCLTAIYTFEKF